MKTVVAIGELLIDFRAAARKAVHSMKSCSSSAWRAAHTGECGDGSRTARRSLPRMVSQVGEDAFGTHILRC